MRDCKFLKTMGDASQKHGKSYSRSAKNHAIRV